MYKDRVLGLELTPEFITRFVQMQHVGWEDFLQRWKIQTALQIVSADTDEKRTKVQARVLLIDELANFSKSLFTIDNAT